MIVIDLSVFVDALFIFSRKRNEIAKKFFREVQNKEIKITEPEIFNLELIGQLVRRMNKREAFMIYKEIVDRVEVIEFENLRKNAFSVVSETGCRAADSFYIAAAKLKNNLLVSNDRKQVENAGKYGVEAYYLIEEGDKVIERIKSLP